MANSSRRRRSRRRNQSFYDSRKILLTLSTTTTTRRLRRTRRRRLQKRPLREVWRSSGTNVMKYLFSSSACNRRLLVHWKVLYLLRIQNVLIARLGHPGDHEWSNWPRDDGIWLPPYPPKTSWAIWVLKPCLGHGHFLFLRLKDFILEIYILLAEVRVNKNWWL